MNQDQVPGSAATARRCSGCGVMPADVTHVCPPLTTTTALTSCPYSAPEWYCTEPVGHTGPHRGEGQT